MKWIKNLASWLIEDNKWVYIIGMILLLTVIILNSGIEPPFKNERNIDDWGWQFPGN